MASVAATIDEAAGPKHVDESLWWDDSFVYLLNDLETIYSAAPPNTDAVNVLMQTLREHHGWLLNLLAFFKLPNSNSRSAVNCPRIIIGKHSIEIKSDLRDMALQLSSFLALDEVQMYILVSRSFKQETLVTTDGIESFLETIAMRYFLERQCLLKCARQILMYNCTGVNAFSEYIAIREEANELLDEGLEDKALVVFKDLLLAKRPSKLIIKKIRRSFQEEHEEARMRNYKKAIAQQCWDWILLLGKHMRSAGKTCKVEGINSLGS